MIAKVIATKRVRFPPLSLIRAIAAKTGVAEPPFQKHYGHCYRIRNDWVGKHSPNTPRIIDNLVVFNILGVSMQGIGSALTSIHLPRTCS
jgi:hypothetical protein